MFQGRRLFENFNPLRNLYCVWIRANERPGSPLVCIWVDRAMAAYEELMQESVRTREMESASAEALDDWPGGTFAPVTTA